jgi:serine/threonine protein kinase
MSGDRLESVERLLHEAQQLPASRRTAFLTGISDPEIRQEVESLLAADADEGSGIGSVISEAAALTGQLAGRLIGHFRIIRPLGHGAMGEVYRAEDSKLGRPVALKMLPLEFQHDAERVRWFEREARAAAALNHPNIITVHEIGESDGRIFIASELIEGETLAQRLAHGAISVAETSRIGSQIASALAAAHAAGIVHRDLKPANIMLRADGNVKVLDFGLARLSRPPGSFGETDETETQTVPGRIMGTLSYMSPEQARGEVVDARSDLWSLGVVMYECLAGRRPFEGASHSQVIAGILEREAPPVRSFNRAVPGPLSQLISQLLTKDAERRLGPSDEVARRLKLFAESDAERAARERRRRWTAIAAVAVVAIGCVSGWSVYRWSKRQWARYEAIPQARSLFDQGNNLRAYQMALDAERYIPNESSLAQLWSDISQSVTVNSEPAGAEVAWLPYADVKAAWQKLGQTPIEKSRIPTGPIRIHVTMSGYEPVEVAVDRVSSLGAASLSTYDFRLERKDSAGSNMVRIPRRAGSSGALSSSQEIAEFQIDRYEVTNREFKDFVNRGGYRDRRFWAVPFVKNGRTISWEEAMSLLVDTTGQPGPATWEAGTYRPGQENYPVSGVSWYEAAAYAAFAGKSLPTVTHWLYAANLETVASDLRFLVPLSNLEGTHSQPVGVSGAVNTLGLYDVVGNVREWCWKDENGKRAILGGSWADKAENPIRNRDTVPPFDRSVTNGFRCVRYKNAEEALKGFGGPIRQESWPDYYKITPVSNEVFEVYKGLYAYEKKPLKPIVEAVEENDVWRRETIRFQAPYGDSTEQVIAYLFLPRQGKPPYQCMLYLADGGTLRPGSGKLIRPESYILLSGRAILYPIYKGTLDRYVKMPPGPISLRDMTIMWHKDLSSSIDYLETRPDIDVHKLGYMGHSMGTRFAPMMLAMEPRIQAAVLLAGAMRPVGALPEVDPINFLPRVNIPVLHVTGRYDSGYPMDLAQKPFFDLLGTSPRNKRQVILPVGHAILVPEVHATVVREVLDWLDRYLGRP